MLHIILTILKIIGILLLLIIGLLLAITICVLFLPIRYCGNSKYNKDERNLQIKVRYLFGIIRFNANWEKNNRNISFKIFAKDMLKERSSKKKRVKTKKAKKTTKGVNKSNAAVKKKDIAAVPKEKDLNTCSVEDNTLDICSADNIKDNALDENITTNKKNNTIFKIKQFIDKVLNIKNKLKAFVQNFINKAKHFLEKLRNINNKKNEYIEFLTDERSKTAIKEIRRLSGVTFKHIRPTKVKGHIRFGTGSPDTTGQLLGLISIFTSDYFKKLSLEADFDNEVIDIDVKFKGRIRIINLVIVAIKLYKIDRLKEFISFVKQ